MDQDDIKEINRLNDTVQNKMAKLVSRLEQDPNQVTDEEQAEVYRIARELRAKIYQATEDDIE